MLHGSRCEDSPGLLNDIWVLDLQSLSWKQHTANKKCACRYQSGTSGLNSSMIFIGGLRLCGSNTDNDIDDDDTIVTTFRLEPKSLQQIAIWTIHQNQSVLPWKSCLPKSSLLVRFLSPAN